MESLSEKLKSLGVKFGTSLQAPTTPEQKSVGIETVVDGQICRNRLGEYYLASWDYLPGTQIGSIILTPEINSEMVVQWAKAAHLAQDPLSHFYFLDTETSSLGGGTGTFAFMVGLCSIDHEGVHVRQFFIRDPSEEPAMLAGLLELLEYATALVTYNGKAFDLPLLRNRFILNRIPMPFGDLPNIDLLHLARRIWKKRLPSRGLKDLEIEILGVRREEIEVPGWMVPELYFEYLRSKNAAPLRGVFYHNRMDVVSLLALHEHFCSLLTDPTQAEACESLDIVAVAQIYDELGFQEKALAYYRAGIEQGLPTQFVAETLLRWADAQFAAGQPIQGIEILQRAANEFNNINACIELAKYYEHRLRQPQEALYWTDLGIRIAFAFSPEDRAMLENLRHRQNRLLRKIAA